MKKIILYISCFIVVLFLSGCSMDNTPTRKVENFLDSYTSNNDTVLGQLKEMVDSDNLMDENQKNTYSDIMKRQYKDMTYEIKDEVIDGDNATVTAEIEVYDYYKINRESQDYYNNNPNEFRTDSNTNADNNDNTNNNNDNGLVGDVKNAAEGVKDAVTDQIDDSKYVAYRLERLKDAKDRVKYTIDFTLKKVDDEWKINDIDDVTRQKIHGLYEH